MRPGSVFLLQQLANVAEVFMTTMILAIKEESEMTDGMVVSIAQPELVTSHTAYLQCQ